MNKILRTHLAAAAALSCALASAPAVASDSLPQRAAMALGAAIASQGNAALAQIRQELKENLLERIAPLLPKPSDTTPVQQPGGTPDSKR
ncbi:MAG: hypothetical protein ACREU7_01845 [Burkholderiales bacterium]